MASRTGPYVLIRNLLLVALLTVVTKAGRVYNFSALGGVAGDMSESVAFKNGALLNSTLQRLQQNDTLVFPNLTFFYDGWYCGAGLGRCHHIV